MFVGEVGVFPLRAERRRKEKTLKKKKNKKKNTRMARRADRARGGPTIRGMLLHDSIAQFPVFHV